MKEVSSSLGRRSFLQASIGAALGFGALGMGLAGCDSSGATSSAAVSSARKLKGMLAHSSFDDGNITNQIAFEALAALGKELGISTKKYSYDSDDNTELTQVNQMDAAGITAFSTVILDNGITREIGLECVRDKMYVSSLAQMGPWVFPSDPAINWHYQGLATPNVGAYVLCKEMFTEVGGKGEFVHLQGAAGSATDAAKTVAVNKALSEFTGMQLVSRQRANYDQETARSVTAEILTAHPNVKVIYTAEDAMAIGAIEALQERDLAGKVLVAGADALPQAIDAIIAGTMFGTEGLGLPVSWGYAMIQALDAANGHQPNPIEGLMVMDLVIVDTAECAQEYKKVSAADIDYTKMSHILHPDDWDPQWPIQHYDPETFWHVDQGVPMPQGFQVPSNYVDAVKNGGYAKIDKEYAAHLANFPYQTAVGKSRTGKTAFQQS